MSVQKQMFASIELLAQRAADKIACGKCPVGKHDSKEIVPKIKALETLYMRAGWYPVQGKPARAVVFSSISVHDGFRGNGVCTALLDAVTNIAIKHGYEYVVFENVCNPDFEAHLKRIGFDAKGEISPVMSKHVPQSSVNN